eukprot:2794613-Pleurochrysis_carterae.AAC.1
MREPSPTLAFMSAHAAFTMCTCTAARSRTQESARSPSFPSLLHSRHAVFWMLSGVHRGVGADSVADGGPRRAARHLSRVRFAHNCRFSRLSSMLGW